MPWFFWPHTIGGGTVGFKAAWTTDSNAIVSVTFFVDMVKNTAHQTVGAEMVLAATGAQFAGTVTVYVTIDGGIQTIGSVGGGICTPQGRGYYSYKPSQAETNGNLIGFTFTGTGAIPVTIQAITTAST